MNRTSFFSAFWRAARPWSLLAGVLLYALGGGIANYLGYIIDWPVYWIGQGAVTALQLSSFFLREYFDLAGQEPFAAPPPRRPRTTPEEDDGVPAPPARVSFLQLGYTAITVAAVLTALLVGIRALNLPALLFLSLSFALAIAYAVPPLRLVYSGYGELAMSILQANFFPALAFLLQSGEFHRLLALLTFPLTFLYLALTLARSLQTYMEDLRRERRTMMARLGWQRGMNVHNLLILFAYFLLGVSVAAGLPWSLAFPVFLSLPVGLFQIWQINGIANGAKPRWRLLSITAMATVGLAVYFMNLALWIN